MSVYFDYAVVNNIHFLTAAVSAIDLNDEWEFRRLLELCRERDSAIAYDLMKIGCQSSNEEIKEAVDDFKSVWPDFTAL